MDIQVKNLTKRILLIIEENNPMNVELELAKIGLNLLDTKLLIDWYKKNFGDYYEEIEKNDFDYIYKLLNDRDEKNDYEDNLLSIFEKCISLDEKNKKKIKTIITVILKIIK